MQVDLNGIVTYLLIPASAIAQIEVHDGKLRACRLRAGKASKELLQTDPTDYVLAM